MTNMIKQESHIFLSSIVPVMETKDLEVWEEISELTIQI